MKFVVLFLLALTAVSAAWPGLDLIVSGWFYAPGHGFYLADRVTFLFLHWLAVQGAWALGIFLVLGFLASAIRRRAILGLGTKSWLFLALALLIGPVLIANMGLKDHWGRARPREVVEFGGTQAFTPALAPQPDAHSNGSFVAGDPAFGFYLTSFAFIAPAPGRARRLCGIGMAAGGLFGLARLAMGAHFLSDILFAGCLMLIVSAALYAALYGIGALRRFGREVFYSE